MLVAMEHASARYRGPVPLVIDSWIPRRAVRRRVIIDTGEVSVRERGIFNIRPWREPLFAFTGVRRRSRMRRGTAVHVVELAHRDPWYDTPLYEGGDLAESRDVWLALAGRLGLPAIDEMVIGPVVFEASALGRPLRWLAQQGGLSVPAPEPLRPPFPLAVRDAGRSAMGLFRMRPAWPPDTIDVMLPVLGPGGLLATGVLLGLASILCIRGIPGDLVALLAAVRVLYCIVALELAAIAGLLLVERRHLAVTGRGVTYCSSWFGRRRQGTTLPLDEVHSVIRPARRVPLGAGGCVIVGAGGATLAVPMITARQASWLGRFVMAAAAGEAWLARLIASADARAPDGAKASADAAADAARPLENG